MGYILPDIPPLISYFLRTCTIAPVVCHPTGPVLTGIIQYVDVTVFAMKIRTDQRPDSFIVFHATTVDVDYDNFVLADNIVVDNFAAHFSDYPVTEAKRTPFRKNRGFEVRG
jgi:hypothetical protein